MASYIPGLASGFDWQSMITQLMEVERRPEQLLNDNKTKLNDRYTAWSSLNTKLLSLKTAASALSSLDDFNLYTSNASITGTNSDAEDFLSFAVGTNASEGTYNITINNLATAQKLATKSFSSTSEDLGLTGDVVINNRVLTIAATDSLADIRSKINALNSGENPTGVTASLITVATGEYRLSLTAQNTGAGGISMANGSGTDILSQLGLADDSLTLRNAITGGAQSGKFSSSTESIEDLLGLTSAASGTITIAGEEISINLSADSLEGIKERINGNTNLQAAGISASIVTSTVDDETTYTLQIDGTQTFEDSGNVLQTLGILKQGYSDVTGVTGTTENTVNGTAISMDTLITDIDGYNTWTSGDTIHIQGTDHDGISVDTDFTIAENSTMGDLLDAVESAFGNEVAAYINGSGAIVVEDNRSGTSSLSLTLASELTNGNSNLDFGTFGSTTVRKREIVSGNDAQITLDGVTITRPSNQINDVITGVTLNLLRADDDATITFNVTRDTDEIKKLIQSFVDSYNEVMTYINDQNTVSADQSSSTSTSSTSTKPLFADSTMQTIKSTLRSGVLSAVGGLDSTLDHLSLIGINIDKVGQLSIDSDKLEGYLKTNFDDVVNLFVAQGTSTNSNLTYLSANGDMPEGDYEIEITQAAMKASTVGAGFSGTLSANAILTLTDNSGRVANISLSAGWNIASLVNAINSELSTAYQEIRVGANKYYADATQTTVIDGDTTWDSVYDATGVSANLAGEDTISFSGTNRSGKAVSGTYTISDTSTETVGDLLSAIEDAYGSGYDAYIDTDGRIAIKDTTAGDSQLTLTIGSLKNLDFGSIDVDETGADGSRDGRSSMDITAENDSGQLKISNDDYGSYSFTIAVTEGSNLGITDGTYTGADVAGRIREAGTSDWMSMTGKGQSLTGDDDQDVKDLVVKYTGTATGAFDFKYIKGVGEKLDRSLYYMADSIDGYVKNKQESLHNQMDKIDQKIDDMEERLTKYQDSLIAKYSAMESMLAQLQAQQSWLTSQIDSLYSNS